jgi:two-component system chemotaxis response regulator CheY
MPKAKILVCDDEENIRESIRLILEDLPYSLCFATNGQEVIDQVKSLKPEVILLDIKMPKLSGLDAISEIKSLSPDAKIIVISGYEQQEVIKEALSRGAVDYLPKSFSAGQLRDSVRASLK